MVKAENVTGRDDGGAGSFAQGRVFEAGGVVKERVPTDSRVAATVGVVI